MPIVFKFWRSVGIEPGERTFLVYVNDPVDPSLSKGLRAPRGSQHSLRATGSAGYIAPHSGVHSDFPTLVRARPALANKVRLRPARGVEARRAQAHPFALLDDPPPELSPVKRPRRSLATKTSGLREWRVGVDQKVAQI